MDDREELSGYVDTWQRACTDFVALARSIDEEQADLPTDLAGWSVRDNIAHTAHLEAVLAGAPEETVEVPDAPHLRGAMNRYTEQGVLARRGRTVAELADEIEQAVAARHAALRADPPVDGSARPDRIFGGIDWDTRTLLRNRPLDVWMHEQDIRRALDRPGNYDSPAAAHTIGYLAGSLPVVVGKRVGPPAGTSVRVEIPQAGVDNAVVVAENGRARPVDPGPIDPGDTDGAAVRITLTPEALVVLAGGRREPEPGTVQVHGEQELGRRVLAAMTVTP